MRWGPSVGVSAHSDVTIGRWRKNVDKDGGLMADRLSFKKRVASQKMSVFERFDVL